MEQDKRDDETSNQPIDNLNVRVEKLLEFGQTVTTTELFPLLEKEAAELINDPFAFALAGVLDRGTKAELIWTIPYYLKKAKKEAKQKIISFTQLFHDKPLQVSKCEKGGKS